jgi:hypothetical protein
MPYNSKTEQEQLLLYSLSHNFVQESLSGGRNHEEAPQLIVIIRRLNDG